ncbi:MULTISPECIES: MarR family transcriptional regulator [unclassified Paenibacillus]|uniref:MarR family transcriptional regulator n=1 Tax=unclassified Paenibacillus TaxID=185978 RepID=UPI0009553700|nr:MULTISPECIES: MarR family transcriptional regulator [unclassified Paenibacillus]ASS65576.2 MarR family transcriptional regulator [Paenibacillus sp. RUD330]SIQ31211.1 hypothetical protein SAMN05880555_1342 [Paenibacillus sp. RU4X]SIQ52909.1 hypothetical protein SAMN05880570_1341 [Paenibacillus sp. RU4T]
MYTKRCLFCDAIVPVKAGPAQEERFIGCDCAPGAEYSLAAGTYDQLGMLPYPRQRELFPLASAYIREMADCGKEIRLGREQVETLPASPQVPATVEAKADRLLAFLRRNSESPGDPVVIHRLSRSYNLTYSQNLQEMVYVIEMLRERELIERTGSTFSLTEGGWSRAELAVSGRTAKTCALVFADKGGELPEWTGHVLPLLQQCGYIPSILTRDEEDGRSLLQQAADADLLLADLTGNPPEAYLATGSAAASGVPVIWTVQDGGAERQPLLEGLSPIVWSRPEELSAILLQRLGSGNQLRKTG